jgi:TonB family protein
MPQPYKLFTIYAREDAQYLSELLGQLRPLELAGRIKVWSDREIDPGVEWEKEIVQKLDTADIILILVSSAYYNSVYIHEVEIKYALSRHNKGEARVLPVIVRPCHFGDDPIISRLQALPTDGKPVTDRRHWPERDDAWLDVVAGVKRTIDALRQAETERERRDEEARQAGIAAQERTEAEKRAAEHRVREQQAGHEREAGEARRLQEQTRREQEAREREAQQQEASLQAELSAWQQATGMHDIAAYENYLTQYQGGEHAREARARVKQLNRENATSLPLWRHIVIGSGALILLIITTIIIGQRLNVKTGHSTSPEPIKTDSIGPQKVVNGLNEVNKTKESVLENNNSTSNPTSQNVLKNRTNATTNRPKTEKEASVVPDTLKQSPKPPPEKDKTYEMFDIQKPPSFPGGETELLKYISQNLRYPALARENFIQGVVALTFVIAKDGSVRNVNIVKDIGGGCGNEAVRLVEAMPNWIPGEANGRPVNVRFTLPVRFKLE